jgi:hypothetical protein
MEGSEGFKARIEAFRRRHLAVQSDAAPPFFLIAAPVNLVKDREQSEDVISRCNRTRHRRSSSSPRPSTW